MAFPHLLEQREELAGHHGVPSREIEGLAQQSEGQGKLAHGAVDNLTITAQLQPITRLTGGWATNGLWQARFFAPSNWLYTLERSTNLLSWAAVSAPTAGPEDRMIGGH